MELLLAGKTSKQIEEEVKCSSATVSKARKMIDSVNRSKDRNTNKPIRNTQVTTEAIKERLCTTDDELDRRMTLMETNELIKYRQTLWDSYRTLEMGDKQAQTNIQVNVSLSGVIEAASKTIDVTQ